MFRLCRRAVDIDIELNDTEDEDEDDDDDTKSTKVDQSRLYKVQGYRWVSAKMASGCASVRYRKITTVGGPT